MRETEGVEGRGEDGGGGKRGKEGDRDTERERQRYIL
jgi:hypothetical protein